MLCISAAYAVVRTLSVRLSRSCIVSKRLIISSKFFHRRVVTPFNSFSVPNVMAIFLGNPLTAAKIAIFDQYIVLGRQLWSKVPIALSGSVCLLRQTDEETPRTSESCLW